MSALATRRALRAVVPAALPALFAAGAALRAHGSERGFVLLLPTGHYLVGGALAVAASFVLLAVVPAGCGHAAGGGAGGGFSRCRN